jgi:ABC-type glutathione transport system ATPase component
MGPEPMIAPLMLDIKNLGKRFPARAGREPPPWIIQDMSFSVGAGELLTIVGPSGAGKSTLLNIIAQIDTASAGEIVFDGERITGAEQKALHPGLNRRVGYVTQGRQPAAVAYDDRQRAVSARGAGHARRWRPGARRRTHRCGRAHGLRALLSA